MTVALVMVVHDSARVVLRCIESVRPLVDTWVVADAASADDTCGLVEAGFDGLPGRLHAIDGDGFGADRTEAIRLARDSADWLLLVEPDQTVQGTGPIRPDPAADAHEVGFEDRDGRYRLPRVLRADVAWRFVPGHHQYVDTDGHAVRTVDGVTIHDHRDGTPQYEELVCTVAAQRQAVTGSPADASSWFALARAADGLGWGADAVAGYRQVVGLGSDEEQRFYSHLRIGTLAVDPANLLEAWHLEPWRAEPLHRLAVIHRSVGNYRQAMAFAESGLALAEPEGLYVEGWIHEWGLDFEWAIAAWWCGHRTEAREVWDRLATLDLPEPYARAVRRNRGLVG
jgi:hypothetical protein